MSCLFECTDLDGKRNPRLSDRPVRGRQRQRSPLLPPTRVAGRPDVVECGKLSHPYRSTGARVPAYHWRALPASLSRLRRSGPCPPTLVMQTRGWRMLACDCADGRKPWAGRCRPGPLPCGAESRRCLRRDAEPGRPASARCAAGYGTRRRWLQLPAPTTRRCRSPLDVVAIVPEATPGYVDAATKAYRPPRRPLPCRHRPGSARPHPLGSPPAR